jgi:predicted permease
MSDIKFAIRQLAKNPGFAAIAVLTLAFSIGANTVIFSLINTVLFKPVMAKHAEQFVALYQQDRGGATPGRWRPFSYLDFVDLRANHYAFADMAAEDQAQVGFRDCGLNEIVPACVVSANYFSMLGVAPILGRGFLPDEETSPAPAAVLTHAFWERLGGDPAIVGRTLKLSRGFATVVGVMPAGFTGDRLLAPAMFLSLGAEEILNSRPNQPPSHILNDRAERQFTIVARLKQGLNLSTVNGALSVLNGIFLQADPREVQMRTLVCAPADRFDYHDQPEHLERQAVPIAALAQGLTLLVLFIACLNLANMLLARGASRRKEIALRLSLGAGRTRILRQLLTEGLLLAFLGGGTGLLVTSWGARVLEAVVAHRTGVELPAINCIVDWRLWTAFAALTLIAMLFLALGPALRLSRLDFNSDLKRTPGADSMERGKDILRIKHLVAIGQMALVMTMLIAASLFAHSAMNALRANPGFDFGSNFYIRIDDRQTADTQPQALQLMRDIMDQISSLPGVASVSPARMIPFGRASSETTVGDPNKPPSPALLAHYNVIGMNYFQTLGVRVLRGREFNRDEIESSNAPPCAIVNQKLADRFWPGQDAIGQTLQIPTGRATVIGVVANVDWSLFEEQQPPEFYEPTAGDFSGTVWNLHVRVAQGFSAERLMASCREALRRFDNRIPVPQIQTLTAMQRTNPQVMLMELGGSLFSLFGAVAVFLSFLGIYGLKAYEVTRRTREIGIRIALGANAGNVLNMILRGSAGLALWGIGLGLLLSLAVGHLASRFLYRVLPFDPLTFCLIPMALLGVVLFACFIPARRAAKVDPMEALRHE